MASTRPTRWLGTAGPVIALALGGAVVASAQSTSPFASKKKRQAWEQPTPAAQPSPAPAPTPAPVPQRSYGTAAPAAPAPTPQTDLETFDWSSLRPSTAELPRAPSHNTLPEGYSAQPSAFSGAVRSTSNPPYAATTLGPAGQGGYGHGPASSAAPRASGGYAQTAPQGYGAPTYPQGQPGYPAQTQNRAGGQGPLAPQRPRGWADRLGLRNLSTLFTGGLRGGAAARDGADGGWEEAFIGDADAELEVSAITDGGLEYGVNLQGRAQYDPDRRGFTRRLPDCPPTLAGCPSVLVNGVPVALRGHTSQFYTAGPDVADEVQVALESAHLFLRSAYGDVTVGRDDGAAYLFSLGAPSLLNVGASNSPVDYTGLDAVKTVNDASGFAEKITYTSPRLLGDRIGAGVQVGLSYAPDPYACGVDYCVDRSDITNVLTPDLKDVMEAGVAVDRTFAGGLSVEGTVTYARASERSGLAAFDDLSSVGAGVEVSLSDFTLGGSWLHSNQGLAAGDYEAWDIGLTWQRGKLGATLGYGHATDDLVRLSSDQITAGVSYDVSERFRLGAGVQHADRDTVRDVAGVAVSGNEKATALFIEGGFTF